MVWLVNLLYSQAHKNSVSRVKDKIMGLFKTNKTENYSKLTRVNNVYRGGKKPRKAKIKKELEDKMQEKMQKLFLRYKKWNKQRHDNKDIRNLFHQEKDYYKPVIMNKYYRNNYIEYESNSDRSKTLSITECLDKIKTIFERYHKWFPIW